MIITASRKLDRSPTTSLALHKRSRPASETMVSSNARAADTTAPTSAPPDIVPSISGSPAVAPPPVDPSKSCPIFSLARELRDMIYTYAFTPNIQAPNDGNTLTVKLGDLAATVPSSALLLTSRQVEQEATAIYRAARRSFWQDVLFSIDLSDDWEDEDAREDRHFEVLDLLDKYFLLLDVSDEQINAMQTFVVNVSSDIGKFKLHLDSNTSPTGAHWRLNQDASTWGDDPTDIMTNGHYPHRSLFEALHAINFPVRNRTNLMFAHRHFHEVSLYARGASGRRYKSMSASREMFANVEMRRAALIMNPPTVTRSGAKKRQLEALLDHCWIVWRARRAA